MKLYHYASEEGFIGMVLNKKMRFTQSTQSNDRKDTVYIHDLIDESREELYLNDEIRENRVIDMMLEIFNKYKDERFIEGDEEKSNKAFVICFTDKSDNRMLWTSYTHDTGYCLGINYDNLNNFIHKIDFEKSDNRVAVMGLLSGVIYNKENQISLIKSILKDEYERYSVLPDDKFSQNIPTIIIPYQLSFTDEKGCIVYKGRKRAFQFRIKEKFELMARSVTHALLFVSPIIKYDYWEDEGEIRFVLYRPVINKSFSDVNLDKRNRNYIEIAIPQEIFEEVIIGPNNPKTINEVKQELLNAGYDVSKIIVKYSRGKHALRERGK